MKDTSEQVCNWETKIKKDGTDVFVTDCGHQSNYKYQFCPFCKNGINDTNEIKSKSEEVEVIMSDVEHIKQGGK